MPSYYIKQSRSRGPLPTTPTTSPPPDDPLTLTVVGGALKRQGSTYVLRGVNTEGVANFASFYAGGINAYIDRLTATDSTGTLWRPNVVRLIFERYPCADPARLYQAGDVRIPLCIPDTSQFPAWPANTAGIIEGNVYTSGGQRYTASKRRWRGDKGAFWNDQDNNFFVVGDIVVGIWSAAEGDASANRVYRCTVAQTAYIPNADVSLGPHGTGTVTDSLNATWQYLGEWGTTGATQPFSGTRIFDGHHGGAQYFDGWIDNLVMWQPVGPDLTPAQAETAWASWTASVLNPTVQRCIDNGIYCFICDFDFGPADLPLRTARMMEFWNRVSTGPWKNHPRVLFDLWNESEDVGSFSGWTWTNQKPYIQAAVNLIRANGATNPILVTTPAFCAFTHLAVADPLTGTNILYANHLYSDYYAGTGNDTNLSIALASGQAIVCSEWGVNQETNTTTVDTFIADFMGRIEAGYGSTHPAAGWLAWAFSQYWSPVFFTDGLYTVPNYYGTKVRGLLAAGGVAPGGGSITGTAGVWTNVTPAGISLGVDVTGSPSWSGYGGVAPLDAYGTAAAQEDPARRGTAYFAGSYQGIWKTTDFGLTWAKCNTGTGGSALDGTSWAMSMPPDGSYLLANNGYGSVGGIYRSTDGGVSWVRTLAGDQTRLYQDPFDSLHVMCSPHGPDNSTPWNESADGGVTWTSIGATPMGIGANGAFLDSSTLIILSPQGLYQGTKSGGVWTWTLRIAADAPHGGMQMHRDATNGFFYVGLLLLANFRQQIYRTTLANRGVTWTLVSDILGGGGYGPCTVYGSPTRIHASGHFSTHGSYGPWGESAAAVPGTAWATETLPAGINNGAERAAVMTDGTRWCYVTVHSNAGVWRYIEP